MINEISANPENATQIIQNFIAKINSMNQPTPLPQQMIMGNMIRPGMMPGMAFQPTAPGFMQRMAPPSMMQPGIYIPGMP